MQKFARYAALAAVVMGLGLALNRSQIPAIAAVVMGQAGLR